VRLKEQNIITKVKTGTRKLILEQKPISITAVGTIETPEPKFD